MAFEAPDLGASPQIPQAQGVVVRTGEGVAITLHNDDRGDSPLMPLESPDFDAVLQIPEAEGLVIRAREGAAAAVQ